jgi:5-methylcytosine-specific restriction endonuclease McrA
MKCYRSGELTPLHKKIRHLQEYFSWRSAVFERDKYCCRDCGMKKRNLEVHHIKFFKTLKVQYKIKTLEDAKNCKELWNINNGLTLCRQCHLKTWNHGGRKRKVAIKKDVVMIETPKICMKSPLKQN